MNVIDSIKARHSTRAFLSTPVAHETVHMILDAAHYAASDKNIQPWHVAIVSGETKKNITEALLQAFRAGEASQMDYEYSAKQLSSLFRKRAIECGKALYAALNIQREDKERRKEVWEWNYQFFGAPVGLLFFLDRDAPTGSWLDLGMFVQNIMLAATEFNLATCPQASLAEYPHLIRPILGEPFLDKLLICGMSLGYPNLDHPVNQYRIARQKVEEFATFYQ